MNVEEIEAAISQVSPDELAHRNEIPTFDSIETLANELAVLASTTAVIGIDGNDGAGKTYLARYIASKIHGEVVSLDDYIEQKGSYIPNLRIEDTRTKVRTAHGPVCIEGICLLEAAEKIGISINKLIYVKRMKGREWPDEVECDSKGRVEDLIRTLGKETLIGVPEGTGELAEPRKEVICYHAKYRPHARADYVFHRQEA